MFWNLKFVLFVILGATIHFISLVDGLKCLECISSKCRQGYENHPPMSITCNSYDYCSKIVYQEHGKNEVQRRCYTKQELNFPYNNLRLNECGEYKDRSGSHEICICDVDNCNSGPDFTPSPKGLKCLECTTDDCLYGIVKPTTISCSKGYYCEKLSSIGKNNTKIIKRNCRRQEYLLSMKLKLNDCGLYDIYWKRPLPTCYCNKDGCNSGDNFEPKPNSDSPPIDCQQCDDNTPTKCSNETHKIDHCESGYICYKLFEVESNVSRVVKRGCIHKEFSSDLGLNINECGQFTNSYNEKQPICICDQDNCNAEGWGKTENQTEGKESPCPNSVPIHFKQVFLISTILVGFIQILIFNN